MKTSAYYLEIKNSKTLLVETDNRDLALKTLSVFTGEEETKLLFKIGKGCIIQNTTVKDTYFKKFLDIEKHPLKDFKILEVIKPCEVCGK